jgi:asparagine synthetase B (glutamine-hydrolysing)
LAGARQTKIPVCGIAAFIGPSEGFFEVMNHAARRGPDGWGIYGAKGGQIKFIQRQLGPWRGLHPSDLGGCDLGIAHFRLATFANANDPRALQPFVRSTGIALAHNGNIYNHAELRTRFKLVTNSDSDSEVLAALVNKFAPEIGLEAALDRALGLMDPLKPYAVAVTDGRQLVIRRHGQPIFQHGHLYGSVQWRPEARLIDEI